MAELALSSFKTLLEAQDVSEIGDTIPIPRFSEQHLITITNQAKKMLCLANPVIYYTGPCIIVGDLHGNLHDLIRIFIMFGLPPNTKYIFLGDYVDRGEYSLEVVTLLFALYILYPYSVVLLRGNHEFRNVNCNYGFKKQILDEYEGENLWEAFNNTFEYLPIICNLNQHIVCLHGGISEKCMDQEIWASLKNGYKFSSKTDSMIEDIVWSDPSNIITTYGSNQRGRGVVYGQVALTAFLRQYDYDKMIRGHEAVDGIAKHFNGTCITVFSTSGYSAYHGGVAFVGTDTEVQTKKLPLTHYNKKEESSFFDVVVPTTNQTEDKTLTLKSLSTNSSSPYFKQSSTAISTGPKPLRTVRSSGSFLALRKTLAIVKPKVNNNNNIPSHIE